MGVKGRFKAVNRKDYLIKCFSISALLVIIAYFMLTNLFITPTLPAFDLQIKDCYYNSSTGYFSVWGTFGIQVPRDYKYYLGFVSITDGNTTIDVRDYHGLWGKEFSCASTFPAHGCYPEGPDWHFYIVGGLTLESKNVQLTFEYSIRHGWSDASKVLERGTKVFSVSVE
jgi:hypothetical protein